MRPEISLNRMETRPERTEHHMKSQIRHLVADALYQVKAYSLPSVCERYGMDPGDSDEAMRSKNRYVMRRLEKLSDEKVFGIAKAALADFPDDALQAAVERLDNDGHLITDLTRHLLTEALGDFSISGKQALLEMLRMHWPEVDNIPSERAFMDTLAHDIEQYALRNDDWGGYEILQRCGFLTCSQAKLFRFLEDVLHPIRRDQDEREAIVAKLNPLLLNDGYRIASTAKMSGRPIYTIIETTPSGVGPADNLISDALITFDELGVHQAWLKALERRSSDPEGAITAAKTLLETVCKHIVEEAGGSYSDNDDLPKLYNIAVEHLSLSPSQHTEKVFRSILGNCQSVVGNLAGIRNRLGDSHGQGKRPVRPAARHAELAVNLAGAMATFLVSTWKDRKR